MRKYLTIFGIVSFFSLLSACSTIEVASDWDHDTDFTRYRSFAWFDHSKAERKPQRPDHLIDTRIHRAIADTLISKGFQQVAPSKADFLVTYFTSTEQKIDIYHSGYGYGYGPWGGWWGSGYYMPTTHVSQYDVGTLVLDIIDARSRDLVWRGMIQKALDKDDRSEESIRDFIHRVLSAFPPHQSGS